MADLYLHVNNHITYAFSIIAFMLSTSLIHNVFKWYQIAIRRVRFHFPLQYNFNYFQFDYGGVQASLTDTGYFFLQRYKHDFKVKTSSLNDRYVVGQSSCS